MDDADYEMVSRYKWQRHRQGYAIRRDYLGGGREAPRYRPMLMHRFILNAPPSLTVDHINQVKWDNRRSNLRLATASQNRGNIKGWSKSGYKGVTWSQYTWQAAIHIGGKRIALGRFRDPKDAARAYNEAAIKHFGEFAYLNEL